MMPMMGPQTMFGMGISMLLWVVPAILLAFLVIGVCVWLMLHLLKKQGISAKPYGDQLQDAYPTYEQGYQAEQQLAQKTSQEAELFSPFSEPTPQYEEPQVQYPQSASSEH